MLKREARETRPAWDQAIRVALGIGALITLGLFMGLNRPESPAADPGSSTAEEPHPLTVGTWKLVLNEPFSKGQLDTDVWATCHWWNDSGCTIATNHELEWYLPENVSVSEGILALTAVRRDTLSPDGREFPFRSGMVSTGPATYKARAGFAFTYGYVEARTRVPSGSGLWPSLWMLPADSSSKPEIDIMQVLGHDPGRLRVHIHAVDDTGAVRSSGANHLGPDLSADWHVFGLWWTESQLVWYLDGTEVWRYEGVDIPSEPMYVVANLAVGGSYAGPPSAATEFPARYLIDYVRVWQRA